MAKLKVIFFLLILPIVLLVILNFLLIFAPEMGFDALWYHLTLPKLWLMKHQWYFPGGLLYYSAMPRLTELLFIPLLKYFGTVGPKALQFFSGLGTGWLIWKILTEQRISKIFRLTAVSLFYCTWLVSWQSGSAYIDLFRTFLETLALYFLLKNSWKIGGLLLGLAIGTKWLSLWSLAIAALIFGPSLVFPALLTASPWLYLAYHFTGNPLFPLFSGLTGNSFLSLFDSLKHLLLVPFYLTKPFDDFLSPLAGFLFILTLLSLRFKNQTNRRLALFGIFGTLSVMTFNPPSSRYLLPYFPALIMSSVLLISTSKSIIKQIFICLTIFSGFIILSLRLYAFQKYWPYLTGQIDQNHFLAQYISKLPDTFIDIDGFVANLPKGSHILVDKYHNLYYFPRDFDHTSWIGSHSGYNYLVTFNQDPLSVQGTLLHQNSLGTQIFKLLP